MLCVDEIWKKILIHNKQNDFSLNKFKFEKNGATKSTFLVKTLQKFGFYEDA